MSQAGEVRLVCCPKCENLLPEVTDYSVYQCGGCGAVLRASEKRVHTDMFSGMSEERIGIKKEGLSVKRDYVNTSDKRMMGLNDGYESDRMSRISSSSRSERKVFRGRPETYRSSLMNKEEMWNRRGDMFRGIASHELRAEVEQEFEDMSLYSENDRFQRERIDRAVDGRNGERYLRPQRLAVENMSYTDSIYSEEGGPLNHLSRRSSGYDFQMSMFGRMRDQLSESGNSSDKGKEKAFLDERMSHQDSYSSSENWHPGRYTAMRSSSPQYSIPDTQLSRPSYRNKYYGDSLLMYRQELGGNGCHHPRHPSNSVPEYGDPSKLHMLRRGPVQAPDPFMKSPPHPYVSQPYRDDGMGYFDPRESYDPSINQHHPACSCFQCCNLRRFPPPVQPSLFSDRLSVVSSDGMYNHRENPTVSFGARDYYSRTANARPLTTHSSLSDTKWSSNVSSVVDGFVPQKPLRVTLDYVGLHCYPLAGGSPFILCYHCLELLLLPKSVPTKSVSRKKVKCGACSTVVVFAFFGKKLVVFPDGEVAEANVNVDDNGNQSPAKGGPVNLDRDTSDDDDDDYDNIGCDFQSMDKPVQPSSVNGIANNVSETKRTNSLSTHTVDMEVGTESSVESDTESNRESDVESMNGPRENCKIADQKEKMREPPPPAGSPLHEYFEHSNKFHVVNRQTEQTTNENSELVKSWPNKSTARQVSLNDSSSATETDMSSNDFTATGTSFDSGDASRRNRKNESFFAGIIKKSFKELSKSNQHVGQEKANVTVNGHLIPHEMIKKAKKVAGPISPGNYWYDYGAGFWGALRGPCLGIIPPYIEEFNYPMPDKCAGGNTDVFVNGRELNRKDMNLLRRRGLPADKNRSYGLEISGRIIYKETGEELKSLGKLAPTVERVQRGFGMRVPKNDP